MMMGPKGSGDFRVLKMRTIADASVTNGAFELIEDIREVNEGPAPHLHKLSDEAFYGLAGRFNFNRGDEVVNADPGTLVFVPARRATSIALWLLGRGS